MADSYHITQQRQHPALLQAIDYTIQLDTDIISADFAASLPLPCSLRSSTSAKLQFSDVCHRRQGMFCKAANIIRAPSLTACSVSTTLNIAAALNSTQSGLQDCDREARDWAARGGHHNQHSLGTTHHQAGMPSSAIPNPLSACRFRCSTSSTLSPLPRWKILRRRHRVASGNVHPARPAASSISSCATLIAMTIAAGRIRWPSPSVGCGSGTPHR